MNKYESTSYIILHSAFDTTATTHSCVLFLLFKETDPKLRVKYVFLFLMLCFAFSNPPLYILSYLSYN